MKKSLLLHLLLIFSTIAFAQQTQLPDFNVEDLGNNKVRIGWNNQYGEDCIQLIVQASTDKSRGFKTIFSTESPQLPQNGFVYTPPFEAVWYFRIQYVLVGDVFSFSPAKQAILITSINNRIPQGDVDSSRIITILTRDSVLTKIDFPTYQQFKDSIALHTKDTLFILSQDEVLLRPFDPFNRFVPSIYVVTNKDGFVELTLPDAERKNYKVIFFDSNGKRLFTLNNIKYNDLVIDKANFLRAGWFRFEIWDGDHLKERNKILLQRDF